MSPAGLRRPAILLSLALLLAACGQSNPSPSADAPTPSATGSGTPRPTGEPTVSPIGTPAVTVYSVKAGDTLYSIARAWGTTVAQLQAWNAERYPSLADDPNGLEAGWELIVSGDPDATPLPTPAPTVSPTPAPIATPVAPTCRAGNRVPTGSAHTYYAVPGAGSAVALTFDMGGRLDPGVEILSFLVDNGICATIFPTGAMADTSPGRQVMAIIRAHPELFEIGNHTMHHCDLVRGGGGSPTTAPCAGVTPTTQFMQQELSTAEAILADLAGQNPQPYWRPPYGSISSAVISAAAAAGYTKTLMWDVDTIDWKPISDGGPTAQQIATKVVTNAGSGSIVLMHLGGYETLAALRIMVPGLRDRGFLLTSISDLLN